MHLIKEHIFGLKKAVKPKPHEEQGRVIVHDQVFVRGDITKNLPVQFGSEFFVALISVPVKNVTTFTIAVGSLRVSMNSSMSLNPNLEVLNTIDYEHHNTLSLIASGGKHIYFRTSNADIFNKWHLALREALSELIFTESFMRISDGSLSIRKIEMAIQKCKLLVPPANCHMLRAKKILSIKLELKQLLSRVSKNPQSVSRDEVKQFLKRAECDRLLSKDSHLQSLRALEPQLLSSDAIDLISAPIAHNASPSSLHSTACALESISASLRDIRDSSGHQSALESLRSPIKNEFQRSLAEVSLVTVKKSSSSDFLNAVTSSNVLKPVDNIFSSSNLPFFGITHNNNYSGGGVLATPTQFNYYSSVMIDDSDAGNLSSLAQWPSSTPIHMASPTLSYNGSSSPDMTPFRRAESKAAARRDKRLRNKVMKFHNTPTPVAQGMQITPPGCVHVIEPTSQSTLKTHSREVECDTNATNDSQTSFHTTCDSADLPEDVHLSPESLSLEESSRRLAVEELDLFMEQLEAMTATNSSACSSNVSTPESMQPIVTLNSIVKQSEIQSVSSTRESAAASSPQDSDCLSVRSCSSTTSSSVASVASTATTLQTASESALDEVISLITELRQGARSAVKAQARTARYDQLRALHRQRRRRSGSHSDSENSASDCDSSVCSDDRRSPEDDEVSALTALSAEESEQHVSTSGRLSAYSSNNRRGVRSIQHSRRSVGNSQQPVRAHSLFRFQQSGAYLEMVQSAKKRQKQHLNSAMGAIETNQVATQSPATTVESEEVHEKEVVRTVLTPEKSALTLISSVQSPPLLCRISPHHNLRMSPAVLMTPSTAGKSICPSPATIITSDNKSNTPAAIVMSTPLAAEVLKQSNTVLSFSAKSPIKQRATVSPPRSPLRCITASHANKSHSHSFHTHDNLPLKTVSQPLHRAVTPMKVEDCEGRGVSVFHMRARESHTNIAVMNAENESPFEVNIAAVNVMQTPLKQSSTRAANGAVFERQSVQSVSVLQGLLSPSEVLFRELTDMHRGCANIATRVKYSCVESMSTTQTTCDEMTSFAQSSLCDPVSQAFEQLVFSNHGESLGNTVASTVTADMSVIISDESAEEKTEEEEKDEDEVVEEEEHSVSDGAHMSDTNGSDVCGTDESINSHASFIISYEQSMSFDHSSPPVLHSLNPTAHCSQEEDTSFTQWGGDIIAIEEDSHTSSCDEDVEHEDEDEGEIESLRMDGDRLFASMSLSGDSWESTSSLGSMSCEEEGEEEEDDCERSSDFTYLDAQGEALLAAGDDSWSAEKADLLLTAREAVCEAVISIKEARVGSLYSVLVLMCVALLFVFSGPSPGLSGLYSVSERTPLSKSHHSRPLETSSIDKMFTPADVSLKPNHLLYPSSFSSTDLEGTASSVSLFPSADQVSGVMTVSQRRRREPVKLTLSLRSAKQRLHDVLQNALKRLGSGLKEGAKRLFGFVTMMPQEHRDIVLDW